ncbi:hypothetical protein TNCV_534311 [Trichonephila clavipes]|nr:hypothetical protein TNCV_534311 [Trichonephila clavipes]
MFKIPRQVGNLISRASARGAHRPFVPKVQNELKLALARPWTYSRHRAENIRKPMYLKPTHVFTFVQCRFRGIDSKTQSRECAGCGMMPQ